MIGRVLQDLAILPENVYNWDETGVMLSMLGSIKVLVGKDDLRDYRGAGVKRITVTAIECISADGRSLRPLIIWPASTHRSNWTTYPTPDDHHGLFPSPSPFFSSDILPTNISQALCREALVTRPLIFCCASGIKPLPHKNCTHARID